MLGALAGALSRGEWGLWPLLINWLALPVLLWPLLQGVTPAELRLALGWHRGRGVAREIACGLIAYLALLPVLAFGLLVTVGLSQFVDQPPYHPIVDWIRSPEPFDLAVIYLVAAVWAPLVEESVFRGALQHYLRGRVGALAAALAGGSIFAVIHPQGILGLPVLVSLAMGFALVREWRGSLIAAVTMHLVHNGLAVTFMILTLR